MSKRPENELWSLQAFSSREDLAARSIISGDAILLALLQRALQIVGGSFLHRGGELDDFDPTSFM